MAPRDLADGTSRARAKRSRMRRMTSRTLALSTTLGLALSAAACKKDETKPPEAPVGDTGGAADPSSAAAGNTGTGTPGAAGAAGTTGAAAAGTGDGQAPAGGDVVRAPTAADLATYTADLKGSGPLVATFKTSLGEIHCELAEKDAPVT